MSDFSITLARSSRPWSLSGAVGVLRTRVGAMLRARQTRRLLAEMDDRMLADIGIGRGDALVEAARPMWDLETRGR